MRNTEGRTAASRVGRVRLLLVLCSLAPLVACTEEPSHRKRPEPSPPAEVKEMIKTKPPGEVLFVERCQDCHRLRGKGGGAGPDLTNITSRANRDYVESVVTNPDGHFPGTAMPSFEGRFTEKELHQLSGYICGEE